MNILIRFLVLSHIPLVTKCHLLAQSWAGFVNSVLLVVSYLQSVFGVDVYGEFKNRAARLTLWAGFLACQMVVMGTSADILDKNCNIYDQMYSPDSSYCKRTRFGITIGAIGTGIALLVVGMKMVTAISPLLVEAVLSFLLCILNAVGVAYLTSPAGPGSPIGNLYYFSWLSWICSFLLLASVYEDYQGLSSKHTEEKDAVDMAVEGNDIGSERYNANEV